MSLTYLRSFFSRPKEASISERIELAQIEAMNALGAKDQFTTIPLIRDLPSAVAIIARNNTFEMKGIPTPPIDQDWPVAQIVWEVPTARAGPVYMDVSVTPHQNERRYIVIVEARAFYALWKLSKGKSWGFDHLPAEPGEFPNMRKWEDQAQCWVHGRANPVPLATVGCSVRHGTGLGFSDGMTRTSWLLHHGASAFPVMAYEKESAHELNSLAGAGLAPVTTVAELAGL